MSEQLSARLPHDACRDLASAHDCSLGFRRVLSAWALRCVPACGQPAGPAEPQEEGPETLSGSPLVLGKKSAGRGGWLYRTGVPTLKRGGNTQSVC